MSAGSGGVEHDGYELQRQVDLAWELYDAEPTHPRIGQLARQVLAVQPDRDGTRILLAMHLMVLEEYVEARDLLHAVIGQGGPRALVDAAEVLTELEKATGDLVEARKWAEVVVREEPDDGHALVDLGRIVSLSGDLEDGWRLLDEGVALVAATEPDELGSVLLLRALTLLKTFAPVDRFVRAAEEAVRFDPSSEFVAVALAWAYLHEGRIDDAEETALRFLRLNPTEAAITPVLDVARTWRGVVERGDATLEELHASGVMEMVWREQRAAILGTDLPSALSALDAVMPDAPRAVLGSPLPAEAVATSGGEEAVLCWHDGQEPGTGHLWGGDESFRLMSNAEITAMDDAIEADPASWPGWSQDGLTDFWVQIATDDDGGYLLATRAEVVLRRTGHDDVVVAPSLADWFWDRVVAFGGHDPRPHRAQPR